MNVKKINYELFDDSTIAGYGFVFSNKALCVHVRCKAYALQNMVIWANQTPLFALD